MIADTNTLTHDSFIQKIKTIRIYSSNANKEDKFMLKSRKYPTWFS